MAKEKPRCAACTLPVKGKLRQTKRGKKIYRGHARCIAGLRKLPKRRNPWTAKDVKRHNKRCAAKTGCRRKWPRIANAVLKKTGDEGRAIRIANWQTKKMGLRRKRRSRRAR